MQFFPPVGPVIAPFRMQPCVLLFEEGPRTDWTCRDVFFLLKAEIGAGVLASQPGYDVVRMRHLSLDRHSVVPFLH